MSAEEARRHPSYGIRGWLAFFALGLLLGGFLLVIGGVVGAVLINEISLGRFLALDIPSIRFLIGNYVISVLATAIICWLLFSKHQSFRSVSSAVLLGIWPAEVLVGILEPSPEATKALALSFLPNALSCAVWVTYLQRSKRVRVTFEHSVKMSQGDVAGTSSLPSAPKTREAQTDTLVVDVTQPSQKTTDAYEDRLYTQIAQELEANTVDKGLWTKAFAQARGDDKQTRVLYIQTRFARLRARESERNDPPTML